MHDIQQIREAQAPKYGLWVNSVLASVRGIGEGAVDRSGMAAGLWHEAQEEDQRRDHRRRHHAGEKQPFSGIVWQTLRHRRHRACLDPTISPIFDPPAVNRSRWGAARRPAAWKRSSPSLAGGYRRACGRARAGGWLSTESTGGKGQPCCAGWHFGGMISPWGNQNNRASLRPCAGNNSAPCTSQPMPG